MHRRATLALATALLLAIPLAAGAGHARSAPLVAGHTTLASFTNSGPPEVNLMGEVACRYEVDHLVLSLPPSLGGGEVACRVGTTVVAVPLGSPDPRAYPAVPTAFHPVVEDRNGITWQVQEVRYLAPDAPGGAPTPHLAWTVAVGPPAVDGPTGRRYDFALALNASAVHGGEAIQLLASPGPLTR